MKKSFIRNNKGITLASLVITITLMLIIASTTTYTTMKRFEINKLKKLSNDLELLEDNVSNYYLKYKGFPILRNEYNNPILYNYASLDFEKNPNDNENYYILDLSAMGDMILNYGKEGYENPNNSDDVYIINEASHSIYYVKGITIDGTVYHYKNDKTSSNNNIPPTKPQIRVVEGNLQKDEDGTEYYTGTVVLELVPGIDKIQNIKKNTYKIIKDDLTYTSETEFPTNNILKLNESETETGTYRITVKTYNNLDTSSETEIEVIIK